MTGFWRFPLAVALVLAAISPAAWADPSPRLLSYECLPSLPEGTAPYATRAAVTRRLAEEVVPAVFDVVGIPADRAETAVVPGGYQRHTNPSLQSGVEIDEAEAERLAAALGYVCRQDAVLVTDFAAASGEPAGAEDTVYVLIGFPAAALTPAVAQAFFDHAATIDPGLGSGYTVLGEAMLFLNLRANDDGAPWSGLTDDAFTAQLRRAAASFQGPPAHVATVGRAQARLVENDWQTAPLGEAYLGRLGRSGAPIVAELAALQARRATIERNAVAP